MFYQVKHNTKSQTLCVNWAKVVMLKSLDLIVLSIVEEKVCSKENYNTMNKHTGGQT